MYGIYFDYHGYDRKLMAICNTIIECKMLLKKVANNYKMSYKDLINEEEYTIRELVINKWTYSL